MVQTVSQLGRAFRDTNVRPCDGEIIHIYNRTHDEVEADFDRYLTRAPLCINNPYNITKSLDATGWNPANEFFCILVNKCNKAGSYRFMLFHEDRLTFAIETPVDRGDSIVYYAGNGEMPANGKYDVKIDDPNGNLITHKTFTLINYPTPPIPPEPPEPIPIPPTVAGIFASIASYFYSLATEYGTIWLLGDVIYDNTWTIGNLFKGVASRFTTWESGLRSIITNIENLRKQISVLTTTIIGFLNWSEIKLSAVATWDILEESADSIVSKATSQVLGVYTSLDNWLDSKRAKVIHWVEDEFEHILDEVFK